MENLCPECSVRVIDIPLSTVGNTAPNRIVSDLQQNPDTNMAIFATNEMAEGLPAAMKTAGIEDVETWGFGSTPANLQDIKEGGLTGALEIDLPVDVWTYVDDRGAGDPRPGTVPGREDGRTAGAGLPVPRTEGHHVRPGHTGGPDIRNTKKSSRNCGQASNP